MNTIKFGQTTFRIAPKRFNPIYMSVLISKLIPAVINAVMFVIADIYQTVITAPAIGVDHAVQAYFSAYNALKRRLFSIWNNFGIYSCRLAEKYQTQRSCRQRRGLVCREHALGRSRIHQLQPYLQ